MSALFLCEPIMRAYFFGNLYISDKQHGIQALHAYVRMSRGRRPDEPEMVTIEEWAWKHETVILLQAGYASNLQRVHDALQALAKDWPAGDPTFPALPVGKFHEEEAALNGALTSVATILPAAVYNLGYLDKRALDDRVNEGGYVDHVDASLDAKTFTPFERAALIIRGFPLA